jgi:hypothetical protein
MRYYDPEVVKEVLKNYARNIRTHEGAMKLYVALGNYLYSRDMHTELLPDSTGRLQPATVIYSRDTDSYSKLPKGMNRETILYIRRGLEERFPGIRQEEAAARRTSSNAQIDEMFVQRLPGASFGMILIPAFDSRFTRRIRFNSKQHFQDIIAALLIQGRVDPMNLTINTADSAIPYLRFIEEL